jgi:predicted kinase
MLKCILTVGCPASGKSTWAKSEIAKDPNNWARINNDDLRAMLNGSVWTADYEKFITDTRNHLIRDALKRGKNVIIDNLNLNRRHFDDVCKIAKSINSDIQVYEKAFYCELDELLARDSLREGKSKVGEKVIKKWWKDSGKTQFKFYKPRVEIFVKSNNALDKNQTIMTQDASKERAVIFDNDGTISLIHSGRSPYDASTCDLDLPHDHVIECMKLYHNAGYKILFVSGREDKDREPTERFYKKHFPEIKYELFMRKTGDMRKDVIIKEEIFNNHIKDRYFIAGWFDDRLQVCKWVYNNGLPLFRVNNPEANF